MEHSMNGQSMTVMTTGAANCNFTIEEVCINKIVLRDDGDGMTITNAAENVVDCINTAFPNRRIFYYDTDGQYDELVHKDGDFIQFMPGERM